MRSGTFHLFFFPYDQVHSSSDECFGIGHEVRLLLRIQQRAIFGKTSRGIPRPLKYGRIHGFIYLCGASSSSCDFFCLRFPNTWTRNHSRRAHWTESVLFFAAGTYLRYRGRPFKRFKKFLLWPAVMCNMQILNIVIFLPRWLNNGVCNSSYVTLCLETLVSTPVPHYAAAYVIGCTIHFVLPLLEATSEKFRIAVERQEYLLLDVSMVVE